MRYKTLWLVIGLVALIANGCSGQEEAATIQALTASGSIRAREMAIASETGGRIQTVAVGVGKAVQAGDTLVTLDSTPWQLQLSPAEAAVAAAQAELDLLSAGAHPAEIEAARASLRLAEAQRDGARRTWEQALAVVEAPQSIDKQLVEARAQLELAAQGVELAEAQLEKQKMLADIYEAGSLQRKAADLQVLAAQETLASAQADAQTIRVLITQLQLIRSNPLGYLAQAHVAEGKYRVAEAGVVVAKAGLDDLLAGPTDAEIAMAEAKVRQAEADANLLRVTIERCALRSPIDAVVVSQALYPGELAAPAASIMTLADLSVVFLDVYVAENQIGRVQVSQAVSVSVDSFPERVFVGYVTKIADEPEFTPRNVATAEERMNTFYAVEIRLDNADLSLKPGMPADALFEGEF